MTKVAEKVAVLGVGGGGSRVAALLASHLGGLADVAIADTDSHCIEELTGVGTRILMGGDWTRHDGCGGDVALGERAASAAVPELRNFLAGGRLLIVVAGLGGGAGSGGAKVVAQLMRDAKLTAVLIVTMPFAFEGSWRRAEAEKSLTVLRSLADAIVVVPNDLLFTTLKADTPAQDAFRIADAVLAEGIAGLARLPVAEGLVTADFASVRALLRHRQATCTLGVGQGTGENRWQDAIRSFLEFPLIGGKDTLAQADGAVVTLVGGTDLRIGEMQMCLAAFEQYFRKNARLVVGAYTDHGMKGEVRLTGLVCRYHEEGVLPPPTPFAASSPTTAAPAATAATEPEARKPAGARKRRKDGQQPELPLVTQTAGVFAGAQQTSIGGQNLDIPTFQRRGVILDVGD